MVTSISSPKRSASIANVNLIKPNQKGEPMDPPKLDVVYSQFYDEIETQVIVNLKLVNTETAYHVFKECKPAIPTR